MLQSIDKKQEKRKSQNAVTVMCHDRKVILSDFDSFCARDRARASLLSSLAIVRMWVEGGPSLSLSLKVCTKHRQTRPVARPASFSRSKKVSAVSLSQRSARLAFEAPVKNRGSIVVSSLTSKTEQRCCIAA